MLGHTNAWKDRAIHFGAGAAAGFTEVSIMHPLDLIKTRMQLQTYKVMMSAAGNQVYYTGIMDCFGKMYRMEGFTSFWKGILPPLLAETPKRAIKFYSFEEYKKAFLTFTSVPAPVIYSLAGSATGITEAILVNPFEVVKVTMQSDRSKSRMTPSSWTVAKEICHSGGIGVNGLYKGLSGTVWRNGVFNMVYFGLIHSGSDIVARYTDQFAALRKIILGFVAGTVASCLNIPFDVAKSRIQGPQPRPGEIKYKTLFATMRMIYIEEGWRALYKGLWPKVVRLGPGGAIMFYVNDAANEFLRNMFPD